MNESLIDSKSRTKILVEAKKWIMLLKFNKIVFIILFNYIVFYLIEHEWFSNPNDNPFSVLKP